MDDYRYDSDVKGFRSGILASQLSRIKAMASQLHARRRHHSFDLESGDPGTPTKEKKAPKSRAIRGELRYAISVVTSFLALGFCLAYILMHHQHRKVVLHIMKNPWAHGGAILKGRAGFRHHFYSGSPRFVTVVMPSVVNPAGHTRRLKAIQDTWGQYARAIYVAHNISEFPDAYHAVISDHSSPQDPYAYPQLLLVPPQIRPDDGLPRLYYTIRTIYEKVNPDFCFFVNDHTFVIPEHVCKYLETRKADQDLYAGHALRQGDDGVFNSGAAGYLLSRATMQKMVEKWGAKDPSCWTDPASASKWIQGNPGLALVQCLDNLNIKAIDTRAMGKWHRFHAFPLTRVVSGTVDGWYHKKHSGMGKLDGFDESFETLLDGEDCCSRGTVSFHYVESKEARALFATREAILRNPHMSDHELKSIMLREWPKTPSDVGGYSRGLPKDSDESGWSSLLTTVRKLSTRETQRDC